MKDERNLDRFDRVFASVFRGVESAGDDLVAQIPGAWLRKLTEKFLTEEEKHQIEALGGLDKILEELRKRLEEQKGRHQGGKKWIGTAGTSPYGAYGYNPAGVRIGQDGNRNNRAVKVWDGATSRILTTRWNSEPGTSSWRCAACAASPVRARSRNSISTAPFAQPHARVGWTSGSCPRSGVP